MIDKALAATVKAELARAGKKVTPVAKRHNISPDILSNMVNGRTTFTDDYLDVVRKELGKPKSWPNSLLRVTESRAPYSAEGRRVSLAGTPLAPIKVVGTVSAGPGSKSVIDRSSVIYVPQILAEIGGLGWEVEGDSMMPVLHPGDVAVFREWHQPRVRIPFLVRTSEGDLRVKRLKWRDNHWHLESVNPSFQPEPMREGDQLLGFLVGWYRAKGSRETLDSDPEGLDLAEV